MFGKIAMSKATDEDIQALVEELKNLRTDFARVGEILKDTARHGSEEAAERIRERAERGWREARTTAKSVIEEIEERPIGAALIAFIIGIVLGLVAGGRR